MKITVSLEEQMSEQTLQEKVLEALRVAFKPGDTFTARDIVKKGDNLHTVQNVLWVLSKNGFLDKPRGPGTKGKYILRSRKAPGKARSKPNGTDPEQVVIDDLLDCMARAEPILKRWSAIREALKGI